MRDFIRQQIQADQVGASLSLAHKYGVRPIYFYGDSWIRPADCFDEIRDLCSQMWTCMGYTGLSTPWHEVADPGVMFRAQSGYIRKWLWKCWDMDVSWQSYLVLSLCMTDYSLYERPAILLGQRSHWTWIRAFRTYAGSRERVDQVAFFMLELIRIQVENNNRAYFPRGSFLAPDFNQKKKDTGKHPFKLELYGRISDRIQQMESEGVDYLEWLSAKCDNLKKVDSATQLHVNAIVRSNSFDPKFEDLRVAAADEWLSIRRFLNLKSECTFPDGSIPKGWQPASDDMDDVSRILMIAADGYYYYADGTQRRGKRHYATNKYLTIRVTPENFGEFRESWYDPRLLSQRPTWDEYSRFALYPEIWNERGDNTSEYKVIKSVKWRKA